MNEKIIKFIEMLLEKNKVMNLTAITDPEEIRIKHIEDSLTIQDYIEKNAKVIDIGTGAGFPGIPLKIQREDIEITLLDSLGKRIKFLQEVVDELELKNVNCIHARAEDYTREKREKYDYAVSRAVAELRVLAEYALPYVKPGGEFISMKGPNSEEEIENAANSIKTLGGEIKEIINTKLSNGDERKIIIIKKVKQTPKKYPRSGNKPKTNPL